MVEPTFLDLIDRLTRVTVSVIETDDGLKRVEQDGLLDIDENKAGEHEIA